MADQTPEQEAWHALYWNHPRSSLSPAAQLEYDRAKLIWEYDERAHKVDRSGANHTFRLRRGMRVFVGIFITGCAVGTIAVLAVSLPNATGSWNILDIVLLAAIGGFFLSGIWFGIRYPFIAVHIRGKKMTIRNPLRTYAIDASEIRAITLEQKDESQAGVIWRPRVHLTDGRSIWLMGLTGNRDEDAPEHELVKIVDHIRALLGITE